MEGCVHSLALSIMEGVEGWRGVYTHWHYIQWRGWRGGGVCTLIGPLYTPWHRGGEGWRGVYTHWHYLQWRGWRGGGVCTLIGTIYNGGGGGVEGCVHSLALYTMEGGRGGGVCALIGTIYNVLCCSADISAT